MKKKSHARTSRHENEKQELLETELERLRERQGGQMETDYWQLLKMRSRENRKRRLSGF
jgi:hypothetical protein